MLCFPSRLSNSEGRLNYLDENCLTVVDELPFETALIFHQTLCPENFATKVLKHMEIIKTIIKKRIKNLNFYNFRTFVIYKFYN